MTAPKPTEGELINMLIDSFGHLWDPEPPMYSCYCEVREVVQNGNEVQAVIDHTIMDLEDIDELVRGEELRGSVWLFTLNIEWDEKSNSWEFRENEHISDNAIWLKETSNPKDCLETIFSQLDFYEHLYENEITSAAFMEQLPDDYKPYYKPYHDEFVANGDFQ